MKHILKFFALLLVVISCQKEEVEILDMRVSIDDIKRIELHSDALSLIPNGKAKMRFYPEVYAEKTTTKYSVVDGNYVTEDVTIEYAVPSDLLKDIDFEITDDKGNKIGDDGFSTTTAKPGSVIEFQAKAGNIISPKLPITIREIPEEPQDELIIPVIFHLIIPPATSGEKYEISTEHLEKVIARVNDIFNCNATSDPNGGNAKVTFKLALYDQKGMKLQEPGINRISITAANIEEAKMYGGTSLVNGYNRYIVKNKSKFIWEPTNYLNLWVLKFATTMSETGSASYKYAAPGYVHSSFSTTSIPGLTLKSKDSYTLNDITFDAITYSKSTSCFDVGMMVNYSALINPMVQGGNAFNLATAFGYYYGLLNPWISSSAPKYPTKDNDYCEDTYFYPFYKPTYVDATVNTQIFKNDSSFVDRPDGLPVRYFTSFNVMDMYTYGNSISADQAARIRSVLEKCPTRWVYKSSFALTGK